MQKLELDRDADMSEVLDLLEQRTTVQQWLARLDEQRGSVSDRVLARVRDDYEKRLRDTLDALAAHRAAIQEALEDAAGRLVAAEAEHRDAVDELEEARLRNVIGEIDDETWSAREGELEEAVRSAADGEEAVRGETERLRDLLAQLEERSGQDDRPADLVFTLDENDGSEPVGEDRETAPASLEQELTPPHGDVLADEITDADPFLDRIERAITGPAITAGDALTDDELAGAESEEDTAPKPGLKCPECGYTNDLSAWFCGVCGADVG